MAFDLAALDRQHGVIRSLVSHDQLELRPEHVVHDGRKDRDGRASPGARQGGLNPLRVGEGFHRRRLPQEHHVDQGIEASDPVELRGLEAHALRPELLVETYGGSGDAEDGAVLGIDGENLVRCEETAGRPNRLEKPGLRRGAQIRLGEPWGGSPGAAATREGGRLLYQVACVIDSYEFVRNT